MRNRNFSKAIILVLIGITLACTIPVNFAPAPAVEEKIVYIEITSTPQEVVAESDTEADDMEPAAEGDVVPVNLDGPWTIWQGTAEQKLSIDFLQKGSDLIGNAATGDGNSMMFMGKISANGKSVSGTWESTSGTSGNFTMELNDALNSFAGNLGGGVPFCGTRMGSSKPYPCMK
jgi:hypothetical protein